MKPRTGETVMTMRIMLLMLSLVFHMITVEAQTSINFEAVTSSTGEKLCGTDKPSDVASNVRNVIRCGAICMVDDTCETYSYKNATKECDMYVGTAPKNYSIVPGCSSYTRQGR